MSVNNKAGHSFDEVRARLGVTEEQSRSVVHDGQGHTGILKRNGEDSVFYDTTAPNETAVPSVTGPMVIEWVAYEPIDTFNPVSGWHPSVSQALPKTVKSTDGTMSIVEANPVVWRGKSGGSPTINTTYIFKSRVATVSSMKAALKTAGLLTKNVFAELSRTEYGEVVLVPTIETGGVGTRNASVAHLSPWLVVRRFAVSKFNFGNYRYASSKAVTPGSVDLTSVSGKLSGNKTEQSHNTRTYRASDYQMRGMSLGATNVANISTTLSELSFFTASRAKDTRVRYLAAPLSAEAQVEKYEYDVNLLRIIKFGYGYHGKIVGNTLHSELGGTVALSPIANEHFPKWNAYYKTSNDSVETPQAMLDAGGFLTNYSLIPMCSGYDTTLPDGGGWFHIKDSAGNIFKVSVLLGSVTRTFKRIYPAPPILFKGGYFEDSFLTSVQYSLTVTAGEIVVANDFFPDVSPSSSTANIGPITWNTPNRSWTLNGRAVDYNSEPAATMSDSTRTGLENGNEISVACYSSSDLQKAIINVVNKPGIDTFFKPLIGAFVVEATGVYPSITISLTPLGTASSSSSVTHASNADVDGWSRFVSGYGSNKAIESSTTRADSLAGWYLPNKTGGFDQWVITSSSHSTVSGFTGQSFPYNWSFTRNTTASLGFACGTISGGTTGQEEATDSGTELGTPLDVYLSSQLAWYGSICDAQSFPLDNQAAYFVKNGGTVLLSACAGRPLSEWLIFSRFVCGSTLGFPSKVIVNGESGEFSVSNGPYTEAFYYI